MLVLWLFKYLSFLIQVLQYDNFPFSSFFLRRREGRYDDCLIKAKGFAQFSIYLLPIILQCSMINTSEKIISWISFLWLLLPSSYSNQDCSIASTCYTTIILTLRFSVILENPLTSSYVDPVSWILSLSLFCFINLIFVKQILLNFSKLGYMENNFWGFPYFLLIVLMGIEF